MDGWRIARLCGVIVAIAIGLLLGRMPADSNREPTPVDPGFDNLALDFSNPETRQALLEHERYLRDWELDSLQCHQGRESYRVFNDPGLMGGDRVIVEAQFDAHNGSIDIREFGPLAAARGRRAYGWIPVSYRMLSPDRFLEVHDQLTDVLRAGAAPRINDRYVDSSRVTLESCRNERYHFFVRNPDTFIEDDGGRLIVRLARSILHLAERDRATTDFR